MGLVKGIKYIGTGNIGHGKCRKVINGLLPLTVWLLLCASALGQQDPDHAFYRYAMEVVNPAFTGSSGRAEATFGVRSQWASVKGAPESQWAIFGATVGRNVGLGVSVLNDRTFIERQTWLAVDFSYRLQLGQGTDLFFGLKGSGSTYGANTEGLVTYGIGMDAGLTGYVGRFTPNVGTGAYLTGDRYYVSLSVPKLLAPERIGLRDGNALLGADRVHYYLSGGYDVPLGASTQLRATSMVRYERSSPVSVELTGILDFGGRIDLGGWYRFGESMGGMFLFNAGDGLLIGYAYGNAVENSIDGIDNATHEVFMRFGL